MTRISAMIPQPPAWLPFLARPQNTPQLLQPSKSLKDANTTTDLKSLAKGPMEKMSLNHLKYFDSFNKANKTAFPKSQDKKTAPVFKDNLPWETAGMFAPVATLDSIPLASLFDPVNFYRALSLTPDLILQGGLMLQFFNLAIMSINAGAKAPNPNHLRTTRLWQIDNVLFFMSSAMLTGMVFMAHALAKNLQIEEAVAMMFITAAATFVSDVYFAHSFQKIHKEDERFTAEKKEAAKPFEESHANLKKMISKLEEDSRASLLKKNYPKNYFRELFEKLELTRIQAKEDIEKLLKAKDLQTVAIQSLDTYLAIHKTYRDLKAAIADINLYGGPQHKYILSEPETVSANQEGGLVMEGIPVNREVDGTLSAMDIPHVKLRLKNEVTGNERDLT